MFPSTFNQALHHINTSYHCRVSLSPIGLTSFTSVSFLFAVKKGHVRVCMGASKRRWQTLSKQFSQQLESGDIYVRESLFSTFFFFSFLLFKRIEIKKQLLTKAKLTGRSTPGTLYPLPRALPHHSYVETSRGQLLNIQATIWNATLAASKPHRHTCRGGGVCVCVCGTRGKCVWHLSKRSQGSSNN